MAISPSGYGKSCTLSMLNAGANKSSWSDTTSDSIKEGFEDSIDYKVVYKNMDYTKTYKTWIYEGDASEKTIGYLHLFSYPYDTLQFNIGDYVQFDYNKDYTNPPSDYDYWLIQALDMRQLYNVHGRILPCNQQLKWIDKQNNVFAYPCYFNIEMTKTSILDSGQGFNVESGALIAIVQNNANVQKIYVNQRFILNGRTFIVYQYNDAIDTGLVYIYMRITAGLPQDDFINGIAYNGFDYEVNVLNGDVLNIPNVSTLPWTSTLNITMFNYNNGVKTSDTFSVVASGVPSNKYTLTSTDNSVTLVNNATYTNNPLELVFTNNTTNQTTTTYVWLGGAL